METYVIPRIWCYGGSQADACNETYLWNDHTPTYLDVQRMSRMSVHIGIFIHCWWGWGVIPASDPDCIWSPHMLNWVHVWTPELASPWPQHPVGPKRLPCHVLNGERHFLGRTQCYAQAPRRPWQHLIPQDLDVPMPVHGSIHHDQLTPPPWWIAPHTMTDRPRFPSLGWTQATISLSSCLRRTRTRPSLWYRENWDSSLKI